MRTFINPKVVRLRNAFVRGRMDAGNGKKQWDRPGNLSTDELYQWMAGHANKVDELARQGIDQRALYKRRVEKAG